MLKRLGKVVDKSLRQMLERSEATKSSYERKEEEWLVKEWVTNVMKRDELVQMEEDLRLRVAEKEHVRGTPDQAGIQRAQSSRRVSNASTALQQQRRSASGLPTNAQQREQRASCALM